MDGEDEPITLRASSTNTRIAALQELSYNISRRMTWCCSRALALPCPSFACSLGVSMKNAMQKLTIEKIKDKGTWRTVLSDRLTYWFSMPRDRNIAAAATSNSLDVEYLSYASLFYPGTGHATTLYSFRPRGKFLRNRNIPTVSLS